MWNKNGLIIAKVLAVVGFIFWLYYFFTHIVGGPLFLTVEDGSRVATQIGFGIYGYVILLVGVMLGAIYQELKVVKAEGRRQIKITPTMRRATRTPDFWLGIFASPVVYVVLLQAIDMTNVTTGSFIGLTLVGLQNGFVCNTVADSLINSGTVGQGPSAQDGKP